jgi:RNA polymerase sigma-B factor
MHGRATFIESGDRGVRAREDQRLFRLYQRTGDPAVRAVLADRFLPLARWLARRYEGAGEPLDDLVQVASLGMLKAIDRFDCDRSVAFTTFAVPKIVGELKRHFRDYGWSVRVPRALQEQAVRVEREEQRLLAELGRAPSAAQLAERLGLEVEQVLEARGASFARRAASLDRPGRDDEEGAPMEVGADDAGFEATEDAATFDGLAVGLSERDREVLRLRFAEDLTQSEIASRIGVSQMQVSRILRRCIAHLHQAAEAGPERSGAGIEPTPRRATTGNRF